MLPLHMSVKFIITAPHSLLHKSIKLYTITLSHYSITWRLWSMSDLLCMNLAKCCLIEAAGLLYLFVSTLAIRCLTHSIMLHFASCCTQDKYPFSEWRLQASTVPVVCCPVQLSLHSLAASLPVLLREMKWNNRLICLPQPLSIPYCQLISVSVCVYVCVSAAVRLNISETKG